MSDIINQIDMDAVLNEPSPKKPVIPEPIVQVTGTGFSEEANMLEHVMKAALRGDYEAFKSAFNDFVKLKSLNVTIHSTTESGMNLAHYATLGNNVAILNMVNKACVDMNAQDIDGKTPLDWVKERTVRNNLRRAGLNIVGNGDFVGSECEPENPEIAEYLQDYSVSQNQQTNVVGIINGCSENITENSNKNAMFTSIKENIR